MGKVAPVDAVQIYLHCVKLLFKMLQKNISKSSAPYNNPPYDIPPGRYPTLDNTSTYDTLPFKKINKKLFRLGKIKVGYC